MGCFLCLKMYCFADSKCTRQYGIPNTEKESLSPDGRGVPKMEAKMLSETLFVITLFVTRVVLPIALTLFLGYRLERKLNQDSH